MKKNFSQEQIQRVNRINILGYCETNSIKLFHRGRQIFLKDVEGVSISGDGRKWYDFYTGCGGGIVQFVMWYKSCTWIEAMCECSCAIK